ncbi:MAG: DNA translocase FtsK [Firmicutes bacterium]|nr:DNA translocase FtsK [Bacillota bacterium]
MAEQKKRTSTTKGKKTAAKKPAAKTTRKRRLTKEEQLRIEAEQQKANRLHDEIAAIVLIAAGLFLVVAMQTNAAGMVGNAIAGFLKGLFGRIAFVLPYYTIGYGIFLLIRLVKPLGSRSLLLFGIMFLLLTMLDSIPWLQEEGVAWSKTFIADTYKSGMQLQSGGAFGMSIGLLLKNIIGIVGAYILGIAGIIVSLLVAINIPLYDLYESWQEKRAERRARREEEEEARILEEERQAKEAAKAAGKTPVKVAFNLPENEEKYGGKPSEEHGKKNILSLMKDNGLFDHKKKEEEQQMELQSDGPVIVDTDAAASELPGSAELAEPEEKVAVPEEPVIKYGLEEPTFVPKGMGLESSPEPETGFGPEGASAAAPDSAAASADGPIIHEPLAADLPAEEPAAEKPKIDLNFEKKSDSKTQELIMPATTAGGESQMVPYRFPPVELLNKGSGPNRTEGASLQAKAKKLEETLHNFGVNATVLQVTKGPTVTRYEIQPAMGVKVNTIVRLADDLALNLEAKSIRIEAPIPGKAAVGIEVENDHVNLVTLREIIESREFKGAKSKLTFAVGKSIEGTPIVGNLKDMPHLLIAGSTGSGKSVCINTLINSILYKAKPSEVKLVLIDPKVVELGNYNGLPHLLIPVVTDPNKAAGALSWAMAEMMDRYKKFAEEGVRDLSSYNDMARANQEEEKVMPQIVIIIDELADLMMVAAKQVEEAICRLAQLARAAGIHLVVATQRPSVDIITGLINANIPSRIAFAVSSRYDSMTILDEPGAEKLVGKGDMLFSPQGMSKPIRVQGCFVSDSEVNKVIEFMKNANGTGTYAEEIMNSLDKPYEAAGGEDDDSDELLQEAVEAVVKAQQASVSMLQRRFRIGYNRAARLVDMMEMRGIVGPQDGTRPRKVMLTEEEYLRLGRDDSEE